MPHYDECTETDLLPLETLVNQFYELMPLIRKLDLENSLANSLDRCDEPLDLGDQQPHITVL